MKKKEGMKKRSEKAAGSYWGRFDEANAKSLFEMIVNEAKEIDKEMKSRFHPGEL